MGIGCPPRRELRRLLEAVRGRAEGTRAELLALLTAVMREEGSGQESHTGTGGPRAGRG